MKSNIFLYILLCFKLTSYSQSSEDFCGFPIDIGNNDDQTVSNAIIYHETNNIFLFGESNNQAMLTCLSYNSDLLWTKTYSNIINNEFVSAVISTNRDAILVLSRSNNNITQSTITKLDLNGNLLWSKNYNIVARKPSQIFEIGSDNYLIFGGRDSGPNNTYYKNIIDGNGTIISSIDIQNNSTFQVSSWSLSGNNYFGVGRDGGSFFYGLGDIIGSASPNFKEVLTTSVSLRLAGSYNNVHYLCTSHLTGTQRHPALIAFDNSMNILWSFELSNFNTSEWGVDFDIDKTNGDLYIRASDIDDSNKSTIFRLDNNGNILNSAKFINPGLIALHEISSGYFLYSQTTMNLINPSSGNDIQFGVLDSTLIDSCLLVPFPNPNITNLVWAPNNKPTTTVNISPSVTNSGSNESTIVYENNLVCSSCDQTPAQTCLNGQFILVDNGTTEAHSISHTDDGGFILAGNTNSSGEGQEDLFITKLDSLNNVEWSNTYGTSSSERGFPIHIIQSPNGYLVSLQSTSLAPSHGGLIVMNLDFNGDIIWQKKIDNNTNFSNSRTLTIDNQGDYLISGTINYNTAGLNDAYLIKMDNIGNLLWSSTYGTIENDHSQGIIQTIDNGYIYAGVDRFHGTGIGSKLLVKVNSAGIYQWSKYYDNGNNEGFYDIAMGLDSNFLLTGVEGSPGNYNPNVTKIDQNGNLIWSKNYSGIGNNISSSIAILDNQQFYISGYGNSFGNGGNDIFLTKLDINGNEIWTKFYGSSGDESRYAASHSMSLNEADGKIYLFANSTTLGGSDKDPYIVITDLEGNSDCNTVDANWTVTNETPTVGNAIGTIGSVGSMSNSNLIINPFNTILDTICITECDEDSILICTNESTKLEICEGDSVQIILPYGTNYLWNPNYNITETNVQNPFLYPNINSEYLISYQNENNCNIIDTINIIVNEKPEVLISPIDTNIEAGSCIKLSASGGVNYLWSPYTYLDYINVPNPNACPTNSIEYKVKVIDSIGCQSEKSVNILVNQKYDCIIMPSAFSPNNDNLNDELFPISFLNEPEIISFRIYNRWGEEVHNNLTPWDGTYKGFKQNLEVYVYYVDYICNGERKSMFGNVSLIR